MNYKYRLHCFNVNTINPIKLELSFNSIGKIAIFFAICAVIPKISFAQYSTGFVTGTNVPYLLVGSLGSNNIGNYQKMQVDVFGGGWTNTTLGKTTYTISNPDVLTINQTTIGGSNRR